MSAAKIFVRERRKSKENGRMPRYRLLAVVGADLKISAEHFRKKELEEIALAVKAELVYLKDSQDESGDDSHD
jgi:hypothetical protein